MTLRRLFSKLSRKVNKALAVGLAFAGSLLFIPAWLWEWKLVFGTIALLVLAHEALQASKVEEQGVPSN